MSIAKKKTAKKTAKKSPDKGGKRAAAKTRTPKVPVSMFSYLQQPVVVPYNKLYLDPNNPRLAESEPPGYDDSTAIFSATVQEKLTDRVYAEYDVKSLEAAIVAHGWMDIDAVVVFRHPRESEKYIVVEGNRRVTALRKLRSQIIPREETKLKKLNKNKESLAKSDLKAQQKRVNHLRKVFEDTEQLKVVPIAAKTLPELEKTLPRVLAVRHISGAKNWGTYAEDLWLFNRYTQMFHQEFPKRDSGGNQV